MDIRRLLPIAWLAVVMAALTLLTTLTAQPAWAHTATTVGFVAAPTNEGDDIPVWVFALGAIIAVGAGALWAIRRRP